jgi:hypothetical protein
MDALFIKYINSICEDIYGQILIVNDKELNILYFYYKFPKGDAHRKKYQSDGANAMLIVPTNIHD